MQQQSKEYKGLIQSGVFFAPIIPQLGFLLFLIHLWLKRADFVTCIKEDFKSRINLIVMSVLSALALLSTILTIAPIGQSIEYLVYILFVILAFYSIRLSAVAIPDLLKAFLYAVSIFTIFGIFQWLFHIEIIKQVGPLLIDINMTNGRIASLAGNSMVLAGLASFAFLIGVVLFINNKTNIRYLYLILAIVAFITELLTLSRANFLVMLLGLTAILLTYYRKKFLVNILIILFVIGLTALFGVYQANLLSGDPGNQGNNIFTRFYNDKTGSGRNVIWSDTITLIKQKPILGYGPNTWKIAMHNLVGDKYGELSDAHNTFLRLSIDFGVPFAVISSIFIFYRLVQRFLGCEKNIINLGLSVSILIIMFLGLIDNPLASINITSIFIILAGLFWRYRKSAIL